MAKVIGIDCGIDHDPATYVVIDTTSGTVVAHGGTSRRGENLVADIAGWIDQHSPLLIYIENGLIAEELQNRGLAVVVSGQTARSKIEMINEFKIGLESGDLKLTDLNSAAAESSMAVYLAWFAVRKTEQRPFKNDWRT